MLVDRETLPKELKRLRIKSGLTQEDLHKLTGVSKAAICRYERENRMPNVITLLRLLKALNRQLEIK